MGGNTDLFGSLGYYQEWGEELRSITLTLGGDGLDSIPEKRSQTSTSGGYPQDCVVVWNYLDDACASEGVAGIVDWHTVTQVLSTGKTLYVDVVDGHDEHSDIHGIGEASEDDASAISGLAGQRTEADDVSELSLDIDGEGVSVSGSVASKQKYKEDDIVGPSRSDLATTKGGINTVKSKSLLPTQSARTLITTGRSGDNVLIVPVLVQNVPSSVQNVPQTTGRSTKTSADAVVGAIQFVKVIKRGEMDAIRLETRERFKSWITSLAAAVYSRNLRSKAAATSLELNRGVNRMDSGSPMCQLLRINSDMDKAALMECADDAETSGGCTCEETEGRRNLPEMIASQMIASQIVQLFASMPLYEFSRSISKMLACKLRADCCVFSRNVDHNLQAGSASDSFYGVLSQWKDGCVRYYS
jgi:hypothetical protein